MVPNVRIFVFAQNFAIRKYSRALISNFTIFFLKISDPNSAFLVPNLKNFILAPSLLLAKFEDTDLKIIILKFQLRTTKIRNFWS